MKLDELQSVRDRERQTDKLQQLRECFYADAGEFIRQLRRERDSAADRAEDPFDAPEVNRLTDEITTAEGTVEAIFEKRIGKIVKAASFAAADLPAQVDGMTTEERDLFDALVGDIEDTRERVLDVIDGDAPVDESSAEGAGPTAPGRPSDSDSDSESGSGTGGDTDGLGAAELMSGGTDAEPTAGASGTGPTSATGNRAVAAADEGETGTTAAGDAEPRADEGPPVREDGGVERTTVRVLADVGAILGVDDREYDLNTADVVTLPAANADPLVEREAAERLD